MHRVVPAALVLFLVLLMMTGVSGAAGPSDFAPVPPSARGPAIPQDKGYLVREINGGLYWVTDGTYQVMFLTTGKGVVAVDAPPSLGQKYLKAVAEVLMLVDIVFPGWVPFMNLALATDVPGFIAAHAQAGRAKISKPRWTT